MDEKPYCSEWKEEKNVGPDYKDKREDESTPEIPKVTAGILSEKKVFKRSEVYVLQKTFSYKNKILKFNKR